MSSKAFAPANISCVFKIHEDTNPRWMGSTGFGFTINEGVIVEVSKADEQSITFNNEPIDFPTVENVIKVLTTEKIAVQITSPLPLGSGFGLSGASALATAYALNKLLNLNKSNKELAIIAHTADVANKTGLGDVTNQYFGGMLVKDQPSSKFIVKKIPLIHCPVYCKYISKLSTKSILTNPQLTTSINRAADEALSSIQELNKPSFGEILTLSKKFAVNSGLLQDEQTKNLIAAIESNNGHASMIMLGNAVMSDIPFAGATKYIISEVGAHLL